MPRRKGRRRRAALSTTPSAAPLLAALLVCLGCRSAPPPWPAGYATVALETPPLQLDPRFATDATSNLIGDLIFASLTRLDDAGRHLPAVAVRWETPNDLTYIFSLDPAYVFHDGTGLTSADVRATFESILDPATRSPKRASLGPLIRIEAPDPLTVRFILAEPFAPFIEATLLGIMPAAQLAEARARPAPRPIGAGPFKLRQGSIDDALLVDRHEAYPRHPAALPGVVFRIIPDAVTRALELRRGGVDLVQNAIEPDALPWLRRQPHLRILSRPGTTAQYLGLNIRHPALADVRVRRALAHAIDRNAIITAVLNGLAMPATGLLSPAHWAYTGAVATYAYDPQRARQLLEEAGLADPDGDGPLPRLRLSYKTSSVELRRRIAESVQEQLRLVGIDLEVRSYEWGTFYADIRRGDFHLYSLAWVGINDPDIYYLTCHSSQVPPDGNNRGFFTDPTIDLLTERARRTTDTTERERLYAETQRRAAEMLPVIPLWWQQQVAVAHRRLHGFRVTPTASFEALAEAWIE